MIEVASARPYANHLHLAADKWPCQYFTTMAGCPSCRPTKCQSTEGTV